MKTADEESVRTAASETDDDDDAVDSGQHNGVCVAGRRLRQRLESDGESSGYASSPTPGRLQRGQQGRRRQQQQRQSGLRKQVGSSPRHSDGEVVQRRRLAPLAVDVSAESPLTSPAPVIDKPREERSFREFFPDLDPGAALRVVLEQPQEELTPSILDAVDQRLARSSAGSSPLSDISSSSVAERLPLASRTSSSLSIRLVFNDPESPRLPAAVPPPPPLRSAGKSAHSYSGTPQSSVVVLAPKKPVVTLPETRFKQVPEEDEGLYRQTAEFKRPESHYIRNVELTEEDLAARVEYDLEVVDREWLRSFNDERAAGSAEVTANVLEELIDGIEKIWFDLVKDVQKAISAIQQEQLPPEESACAICGEEECDNTNAIVFCDGCNLAVHQDCYGVPYIPEGQWLCRKCMLSPDTPVACLLCPQRGGAFKKTTANKWAHLLCALWIPEVGIANSVYMEPIDSVDQIPRSRWKLYCSLCHRKVGACIQCSQKQCVTAFHATCARKARLSMAVRVDRRSGDTVFRAFCERHTPASHALKIDLAAPLKGVLSAAAAARRKTAVGGTATPLALSLVSADLASLLATSNGSNRLSLAGAAGADGTATPTNGAGAGLWPGSAVALLSHADGEVAEQFWRAARGADDDASLQLTMRIFNPDHPVLNAYAFGQVLERTHVGRMGQAQRARVVARVGRFWALKRGVRHGAPLLKRLHLEPWTASVTKQRALEMAEEQRQAFVRRVRNDLERVRMLVESVRRRERDKLRRARVQVEYLQMALDPLTPLMRDVLADVERRDPRGVFAQPVGVEDAPDYDKIVTEPMDLGTVRRKLADFEYHRGEKPPLDLFERDLRLVCTNCMAYNRPTTYYFQLAARVLRHVDRLMAEARKHAERLPIDARTGCLMAGIDFDIFSLDARDPVAPSSPPEKEEEEEPVVVEEETSSPPLTRSQQRRSGGHAKMVGKKAVRRMTQFEKLSLPPPDARMVRQSLGRQQQQPPSADVNVLKDRLRRTSLVAASEESPKRKGRNDSAKNKEALRNKERVSSPPLKNKERVSSPNGPAAHEPEEEPPKEPLASGTLVWVPEDDDGASWFPAEIIRPDDWRVPKDVRDAQTEGGGETLVRLFRSGGDSSAERQWRWVVGEIRRMGVDAALDTELYGDGARSVRLAYREAFRMKRVRHIINTKSFD
ncbi:hypothetical protein GGI24_002050 [Coemansia furcata]|nr:hypothetical protein GGI24_002050 [Coemansia furcata]